MENSLSHMSWNICTPVQFFGKICEKIAVKDGMYIFKDDFHSKQYFFFFINYLLPFA